MSSRAASVRRVPIVLLRRGTSFAGAGEYTTIGVDVRPFRALQVELWRGTIVGGGPPGFQMFLEGSSDGVSWYDIGGGGIDPDGDGTTVTVAISYRLFRVRAALTGSNPVVSCHAIGYLAQE